MKKWYNIEGSNVSIEGLSVVGNFVDTADPNAPSIEYLYVIGNFVDTVSSSVSLEYVHVVGVFVDTYP